MADRLVDEFRRTVVEPFEVYRAGAARPLGYSEYLSLPDEDRHGDEANVVDNRFTQALLSWLGWTQGDYDYNAPEASGSPLGF